MRLQQALEIWNLKIEDFTTLTDYQVEVVSIALDQDPEDVYEWSLQRLKDEFAIALRNINNTQRAPQKIVLLGQELELIPFHNLTLGAFIDLEHFCSSNEKILEVCSILYRRKTSNIWDTDDWEEYGSWVSKRKEYFRDAALETAGAKIEYLKWRENVTNQYSGLFETPYEQDPEDQEAMSALEREKLKREESRQKAFSWEATLLLLAKGNASYVPNILKMPVLLAFNLLSSLKIHSK